MNTKYKAGLIPFSIFCFLASGLGFVAQEQEATGIKIQPSIIEERADPGQIFTSVLRATNLSKETQTFYIIKRNISRLSDEGGPIFAGEQEETGFEISSWVKITDKPVIIEGGQTKEIPFSIKVPKDAGPGGHFGAILLSIRPEVPEETGLGVGYRVGTIINLRISGEIFEEAQIREFRTDKTIYSKSEVKFITRVENIGNVLVRPRGPLEITDFFGKSAAILRINDEAGGIFPGAIREFETTWQGEGFTFGRYQVVMALVYGEEGRKTISSTLSFWVLPLNIILPIVGGTLGLILAVFVFVKLHIRRQIENIRRATEGSEYQKRFKSSEVYTGGYQKSAPFPKLALVSIVMLFFTMIFLIVLFFLFA